MGQELNIINNRQIISYLAEKFPNCFVLTGTVKPLKLGIFQDIIENLKDELPVSKTQLRAALRSYTASYSYLEGIKLDNRRVDLMGELCEAITESHVEYAQKIMAERKAKREIFLKKKAALAKKNKPVLPVRDKTLPHSKKRPNAKPIKKPAQPVVPKIDLEQLKIGQNIQMAIGKSSFNATILEIVESNVRVQLPTGLTMTVKKSVLQ